MKPRCGQDVCIGAMKPRVRADRQWQDANSDGERSDDGSTFVRVARVSARRRCCSVKAPDSRGEWRDARRRCGGWIQRRSSACNSDRIYRLTVGSVRQRGRHFSSCLVLTIAGSSRRRLRLKSCLQAIKGPVLRLCNFRSRSYSDSLRIALCCNNHGATTSAAIDGARLPARHHGSECAADSSGLVTEQKQERHASNAELHQRPRESCMDRTLTPCSCWSLCFADVLSSHAESIEWSTQQLHALTAAESGSSSAGVAAFLTPAAAAAAAPAALPAAAAQRISQLDALALDSELGWMLSSQLRRVCKYLPQGSWLADHKAEAELALHATMFACTVGRDRPTPGMKLQNLQFQNYAAVRHMQRGGLIGAGRQSGVAGWVDRMLRDAWRRGAMLLPLKQQIASSESAATSSAAAAAASSLPSTAALAVASHASLGNLPLSHFAPSSSSAASSSMPLLLEDASAASSAGALPSAPAAAAVLLSSLPSTAPLGLSTAQKSLYFIGSVLLRYAWSKLNHEMTMDGQSTINCAHSLQICIASHRIASHHVASCLALRSLPCWRFSSLCVRATFVDRMGRLSGRRLAPTCVQAVSPHRARLPSQQHHQLHCVLARGEVRAHKQLHHAQQGPKRESEATTAQHLMLSFIVAFCLSSVRPGIAVCWSACCPSGWCTFVLV